MKQVLIALLCCAALLAGQASAPPVRAAAPGADTPVEVAATMGGQITAAAVDGEIAYVGEGASLATIDISDPAAPQVLGRAPLDDAVRSIVVAGGFVYVAGHQGLWTLDVRDPARPIRTDTFALSFVPRRVHVDAGLLYLIPFSEMGSLLIFDLTDPARPALLSTLTGQIDDAQVSGRTLYLLDRHQGGLVIFDLSEPRIPQIRGRYAPLGLTSGVTYKGLAVDGTRLVMAIETGQSSTPHLLTLDIANPAAPALLADAPFDTDWPTLAGNLLVTIDLASQIRLVDMSNAGNPIVLSGYPVKAGWVQISGGRLYAVGDVGLVILDIRNPSAPALLGSYAGRPSLGSVSRLRRVGQRLYASSITGVQILDVSRPLTPTLQGFIPFTALQWLRFDGDRMYGLDAHGLRIIDVSNPVSPTQRLAIDSVQDARLVGDLAYLTSGDELQIYNIADTGSPALLGKLALPRLSSFDALRVWVVGANAYVGRFYEVGCGRGCTQGRVELTVVDVGAPASPRARGRVDFVAYPYSEDPVAVVGTAIYLAGSFSLIDASNPNAPAVRDAGPLKGADAVQIAGTRAYALSGGALRTVDLSDPLNLRLIGELRFGGTRGSLAIDQGVAYVASNGLRVVDLSDPANPRPRATHAAPVEDLALVDGGYLYLALGDGGLRIVRANHDAFPRPVYLPLATRF